MVRFKNRYIVIKVSRKNKSDDKSLIYSSVDIHNAVIKKVTEMYGDFGAAACKAGFTAKYCNARTKIAIIKIRHKPHVFLLNCIPKINDVGGKLVNLEILYVGATIKHCFIFIKKYQTQKLKSMWSKMKNDSERKRLEEALMTMTPDVKDLITGDNKTSLVITDEKSVLL